MMEPLLSGDDPQPLPEEASIAMERLEKRREPNSESGMGSPPHSEFLAFCLAVMWAVLWF